MIKTFCDACGQEITEQLALSQGRSGDRLAATLSRGGKTLSVEVLTSLNSTANAGQFCKHCVLDALYKLDDRPTARPTPERVR